MLFTHMSGRNQSLATCPGGSQSRCTHQVLVYLVGDDGYKIATRYFEDVKQMLLAVNGATRVGRVVDDQRRRVPVDLLLELHQVHFPALVWLQINEGR